MARTQAQLISRSPIEQLHPATNLQFGGQQYGGPRQGEGYPAVTGSFEAMGMHGSPPMWNDDVRSVNSFAGFEGRSSSHLMDSDGHSLASFPPPSHRRTQGRPQGGSGRLAPGAGESYVTPLQRAFGQGQSNFASGAPSAILPPLPPLPDLSDAPRRRELHNSGRKMVARDAGRPYPSFAHSRTNSSSSVPTAAMDPHHLDGGLPMSGDEPAKPLRALNRDHETYVWKEEQGQLYRVAPGSAPSHGEMLVFPAGSCELGLSYFSMGITDSSRSQTTKCTRTTSRSSLPTRRRAPTIGSEGNRASPSARASASRTR